MRTHTRASAIFAANRAQGKVAFDVSLGDGKSHAVDVCMSPARCACGSLAREAEGLPP